MVGPYRDPQKTHLPSVTWFYSPLNFPHNIYFILFFKYNTSSQVGSFKKETSKF